MNFLRRLLSFFRRSKLDREMDDELRFHVEEQTRANLAAGMSPADAALAARKQFGWRDRIREEARDQRGGIFVETLFRDIGYAVRGLRKNPGFTAVAVLTLALGIGVSTALFSVVYGVLLAPFPYARPGEILTPEIVDATTGRPWSLRLAEFIELQKLPAVKSAIAARFLPATLSGGINPEILEAPRVTGNAFRFLGVAPVIGRGLTPDDIKANGEPEPVAVLSFKLWQRLFNGDRDVLDRTIVLDDQPHRIVGVMPPRFAWQTSTGLWLPMAMTDLNRGVRPLVRLHPGASPDVAGAQLLVLLQGAAKQSPGSYPKEGFTAGFANFLDRTAASGEMRTSLHLLLYAVGFLLAIACANVANLQLARATARSREIAVRLALGAGRSRVIRQLLTESVALALVGGAVGVLLAFGLTRAIVVLMPDYYVPQEAVVTMNGWVLLFSLALSLVTGVLFGLAPGLQCTRPDLNDTLKAGGSGATAGAGHRTRQALVVAELALSIVLLVGATLAMRGFAEMQRVDRGFRFERLLVARVSLNAQRYATLQQRNDFARDFAERLRALPGVASATLGNLPANEAGSGGTISGQAKISAGLALNYVDADYLSTLGMVLRAGRNLTPDDVARGNRVALVTETTAKLWADGQSPIGRIIAVDSLTGGGMGNLAPKDAAKEVTVVGVIVDVRTRDKRQPPVSGILVPYSLRGPLERPFVVRAHGDPSALINAVRAELRAMDPELPMLQPGVVEQVFEQQAMPPRFNMILFACLAAVALALAAAGIYGVLSYVVAQRTREIGVRMALGAARGDIIRLVLGSGGRLLLAGVAIGVAVSVALMQIVKSQVFGVPLLDPLALACAVVALCVVALLACWWPARRATKVDPLIALRAE